MLPEEAECIGTIRCLSADMVQAANSGHPGMPLGMASVAYVLFTEYLSFDPDDPKWYNRDRFVLSNGHGCALLYTMLHLCGYSLSMDDLKAFRQLNSLTPGHPEVHLTPGVEATTGPLGQGISNAVGMAIAQTNLNSRFDGVINHKIYCFCGDGCLMEGIGQEALSLGGHLQLENLIVIYDDNKISIDGPTSLAFTEDVRMKAEACGWRVITVEEGNEDLTAIRQALDQARVSCGQPTLIQLRTTIGYGSKLAGTAKVHGAPLGSDNVALLKEAMGLDPSDSFQVSENVYAKFRIASQRGKEQHRAWDEIVSNYATASPEKFTELSYFLENRLPEGWESQLPRFSPGDKSLATRQSSNLVLNALASILPTLIGGSADLTPSNLTAPNGAIDFQASTPEGRYIRFGVREHVMVAISTAIATYGGFVPYCGTFLNFIGYAAGATRVAAISEAGVILVATHDSIGLGEDGPTHQPVELLSMLRAMPNMVVIRPADSNEVSGAYLHAIRDRHRPTCIALTRQAVPNLEKSSPEQVLLGAYVAYDPESSPEVDVIVVASGSEVGLALSAANLVAPLRVRVVSMPSWELFEEQDASYKQSIFLEGVPVLSVEALSTFGWSRYSHAQIGLDRFGLSAPGEALFEYFGFTPQRIAEHMQQLVKSFSNRVVPALPCVFNPLG